MISTETFDRLRKYETSSWAVWSNNGDNSVSFFKGNLDALHGRVIFVGLNRSSSWSAVGNDHLANFHARRHVGDARLKRQIQDSALEYMIGGFMTDISDEIETDSGRVKLTIEEAVNQFKDKAIGLDENRSRFIVCFGDKVFGAFRKGLGVKTWAIKEIENEMKSFERRIGEEEWHFYRVWHYSNYGKLLAKAEEVLPKQLRAVNEYAALASSD